MVLRPLERGMVDEANHRSIGALTCFHSTICTALSKIELSNNTVIILADDEAIVAMLYCRDAKERLINTLLI